MTTEEKKKLAERFGVTNLDAMREVDWIILAALAQLQDTPGQVVNIHGASLDRDEMEKRIDETLQRGARFTK